MIDSKFLKISVFDFIAIFVILFLSIFLFYKSANGEKGNKALIFKEDRIVKEVDLNNNLIFEIENMKIEVKNGKIRVLSSDCPNKICVKRGFISKKGESIICAPNKVMILIEGRGDLDSITF